MHHILGMKFAKTFEDFFLITNPYNWSFRIYIDCSSLKAGLILKTKNIYHEH